MYLARFLGYAADHHGRLWGAECVVVDLDRRSRDVGTVLAIAAAVHVEAMAERGAQFHIVSGHIRAAGSSRPGDGMAIPVEQVELD